jgi:DNA-binding winged helix-turn-helix (wHTH) protein/tetratricopeptide (TPR) repeat protein
MSSSSPLQPLYAFSSYRLDPGNCELLHDGHSLPITSKAFQLLLILVENHGRLVRKDELMRRLWPDVEVEEANLIQNIYLIRKLLGKNSQKYIETVPRQGYRFIAGVQESWSTHSISSHLQEQAKTNAILQVKSLAVLPFRTLGEVIGEEYIGLGMADVLTTKLGTVEQLSVRPTSAIFKYVNGQCDALVAGRSLKVDGILEGTIQTVGDRIRVTVQLIRISDYQQLWSEMFDEKFSDVFALQDTISEQVVRALELRMNGDERMRKAKHFTVNIEAYKEYTLGFYFWAKRTKEGVKRCIEYFEGAIRKDPGYALAYAGLADAYGLVGFYGYFPPDRTEAFERARASAQKALSIDPMLAEGYTALALVKSYYERDFPATESALRRAIALDPNYALAHLRYANLLHELEKLDDAFKEYLKAHELDPLSVIVSHNLSYILYLQREYDLAAEYVQKALEVDPLNPEAISLLGMIHERKGNYEEALSCFNRSKELSAGACYGYCDKLENIGHLYAVTGHTDKARELLREIDRLSRQTPIVKYFKLRIHVGLGEMEAAARLIKNPPQQYVAALNDINTDPRLDGLRSALASNGSSSGVLKSVLETDRARRRA